MKNKIAYKIYTPYGDIYELSKDGYVLKCNNRLDKTNASIQDLKTWQIIGIEEILPFNNLGRLISISEAVNISCFTFKNGNPKYAIIDIDHGTRRIHCNTKYHGIRSIFKVN